jgi:hypothetical protein
VRLRRRRTLRRRLRLRGHGQQRSFRARL